MPSRLTILQQQRAGLVARMDALLEDPAATAEQADALRVEINGVDTDIASFEQLMAIDRTAPAASSHRVAPGSSAQIEVTPNVDPTGGFANLAEMALAVRSAVTRTGRTDPRLDAIAGIGAAAPTNYHQETGTTEGWEVPPQMREQIWELAFQGTDLLSLLAMEPTNSNSIEMGADESTPWGSTGIQAFWRVEADEMTASKLATKGKRTDLHELYAFVGATEELLADAPRLNSRLTRGAARAIEWVGSEAFMNGDGVGKPKGWMNSPALVTVSKESGQAAATLNTKNLGKMFARLYRGAGSQPLWIANADVLPQLIELTIGQVPVWIPQNQGMQGAPGGSILGIGTHFSEHNQSLGTVGDIQLIDLSGYYAAMRTGGIQFAESIHLWFDLNMKAFRWTVRMGGQPMLSAAIQPAKGSNTKSHFVCLETRS
jgi:HK97 family phage major capsid protein